MTHDEAMKLARELKDADFDELHQFRDLRALCDYILFGDMKREIENAAQEPNKPIDVIMAGDAFRRSMIAKADAYSGPAPLWHGWVIMDAFRAGVDYARRDDSLIQSIAPKENGE